MANKKALANINEHVSATLKKVIAKYDECGRHTNTSILPETPSERNVPESRMQKIERQVMLSGE
ncbi:MAG: hypothetical protein ABSB71_08385 [Candidatus Bathyarchaeia archaeon]|jgi:hypothetical protein